MLSGKTFPHLGRGPIWVTCCGVCRGFFALRPEKTLLLVMLVNPSAYGDAISKFSVERKTSRSARGGVNLCRILLGLLLAKSAVWEKKTCWNTRTSEQSCWVRSEVPLDQHCAHSGERNASRRIQLYDQYRPLFKKKRKKKQNLWI